MKLFSLGITDISCSPLFIVLFAAACICGNGDVFALYMAAVTLHEAAHWLMAHMLGYRVSKLKVMPYGCSAEITGLANAFDELMIALAGPVFSIVAFMGCRLISNVAAVEFAKANVYIAAVNMLPAYPLDGGRIVKSALRARNVKLHKSLQRLISFAAGGAVLICGIYTENITFDIFGVFVLHSALRLSKETVSPALNHIIRTKKFREIGYIEAENIAVWDSITLNRALGRCGGEKFTVFTVLDDKMNIVCSLSCTQVIELCVKYGGERRIKDIVSLTQTGIGDKIIIGKDD